MEYQLKTEIIEPIEAFLKELKEKADDITINITKGSHGLHYIISCNHSQIIKIELEIVIEENFWKEYETNSDYGRPFTKRELKIGHGLGVTI